MKEIKDLLQEQKFFQELSPEMLEFIAGCGHNAHYAPGEYLGKEGTPSDTLWIIRTGKIGANLMHPVRGEMTIFTISPGEIAGFSWIIPPYRLTFDVKALEHTSVIALDGKCLRKKCEEDIHLGYLLMKQSASIMAKRLQDTRMQLLDVYSTV